VAPEEPVLEQKPNVKPNLVSAEYVEPEDQEAANISLVLSDQKENMPS
jgi:hypothetical protein